MAYIVIYLLLPNVLSAQTANALTQFVTAGCNTDANRRITFGIRGRMHAARHQIQGLIAFTAGLAFTSAALAVLHAILPQPARATEITVLLTASLLATLVKYVLFRSWVFRPRQAPQEPLGTGRVAGADAWRDLPRGRGTPPRQPQATPWSGPRSQTDAQPAR